MSNIKQIRGQIRQIVQEILPDLIREELFKDLEAKIAARLTQIADGTRSDVKALGEQVNKTLTVIDERSKSVQHYVMRQGATAQAVKTGESNNE